MKLYPLFFQPIYKRYLWGGEKIKNHFLRDIEGMVAESWEISDRIEEMSIVQNGPLKGKSIHALIETMKEELLGEKASFSVFPLLVKIIDAEKNLSLQVHPDEEAGKRENVEPKYEAWYVLEADSGAGIYAGFKECVKKDLVIEAIQRKKLADLLHFYPIRKGDMIEIPGGRVHAIGKGALLLEVQQNSDTTYRLYDWDRIGPDKKPRELHIEKALEVANLKDTQNPFQAAKMIEDKEEYKRISLFFSEHFSIDRIDVHKSFSIPFDARSFSILFVVEGKGDIECEEGTWRMRKGDTILLPAALHGANVFPISAKDRLPKENFSFLLIR